MIAVRALFIALLFFGWAGAETAIAQTMPGMVAGTTSEEPAQTPPPSPNDVRELMRLLSDPGMVEWLRTQSEDGEGTLAAQPGTSLRDEFAARANEIRERLSALAVSWRNLPSAPAYLADVWRSNITADQTLRSITYVLIFLVVGGGLEWLYRQYVQAILNRLELRRSYTLWARVSAALLRAALMLGGLAVFSVGTIGTFLSFDWPPLVENVVMNLLIVVITVRSAHTLSIFLLAPRIAELRLVPLQSDMARPLHGWITLLATVAATAFAIADIFSHLAGTTDAVGATLAVTVLAGLLCTALLLAAIWHISAVNRRAQMLGQNTAKPRRRFWPGFLSVLLVAAFILWLLGATAMMWTLTVLGLIVPVTRLTNALVDHLFNQAEGRIQPETTIEKPAAEADNVAEATDIPSPEPADVEAATTPDTEADDDEPEDIVGPYELYRPVVRRLARFVILIGALFTVLYVWEGNIFALSESQTAAGRLVGILADVLAAVLVADLVWVWAKSAIDRRLANYVPPQGSEAPGPEARMATLLPILRMTLMIFLIVVVAMTILASLGINIGPLLAGAGVIGIAIGFGAQALVRDIVSGIFFLVDDAFRIGEYIEIGELRGTVESMSIRSLRVRHHLGAIHTIPFGELKSLTNYSRDWVIMRLEFRVPFDTDVKLVKKIVKKIGAELLEHEGYGTSIIQTLKSQGVRRMEEFNMVIGVKFMAKPGAQWLIRRDAYQKLRDAFEANGINFAQRNVTVEVVGDRELDEEAKKAIAGAVQPAIEAQQAQGAAPDEP
nr:mechanosensitive ion channel family protein [Hoeflea prorocentri]